MITVVFYKLSNILNGKTFKKLEHNEKRRYLLDIFSSTKDQYPIYMKTYNLLSSNEDLSEEILDKIYENVEKIGQENERIKRENIQLKEDEIKKLEEIEREKEIGEIEKYFT